MTIYVTELCPFISQDKERVRSQAIVTVEKLKCDRTYFSFMLCTCAQKQKIVMCMSYRLELNHLFPLVVKH